MKTLLSLAFAFLTFGLYAQKEASSVNTFDEILYPFPTQKVQLDDELEIAYFDEGKGSKTIIFIHGLGSYAPAWKKNIEGLRENYRCIAIDLPGYGKSSKGNYEASMSYYATTVKNFMQKLGIDSAILAGHSMGGQISITTALAYPDIVEQLILVSPAGFETFHKGEKEWLRNVLTPTAIKLSSVDQIKENIAWNFYQLPDDALFMINDRIAMRNAEGFDAYCYIITQCIKGMVDQPVFDHLSDVKQPTLVFYGHQDNLIPNRFLHGGKTIEIGQQGTEQMPNAKLVMIDEAGHFVHFEKADTVNQEIRAFLK